MLKKIRITVLVCCLTVLSVQAQEYVSYKVLPGDSIEVISRKLGVSTFNLLKLNPDIEAGLTEGQLIIVPNKDFKPVNDIEDGDYVEGGFLYHKVLPKENYFQFKKQYGVSKRDLRKYNLSLRSEGIKAGTVLKIPVDKDFKLPSFYQKEETKPYLVLPQQTKYMIAKKFGISVEELDALNPTLAHEVLKANTIIKVPNKKSIPVQDENYIFYQVVKDDNFFRITQRFHTTKEQLIALNPELENGVKLGMVIKINKIGANPEDHFVPLSLEGKKIKLAMVLPFMANASIDFSNQRTANYVTDFYLGAMMALDSLRKQGLTIDLKILDSENNREKVLALYENRNFDDVDAIIGPMYYNNVRLLAPRIKIPLVSPVSDKDHKVFATRSTVQATTKKETLAKKMLAYIKAHYEGQELTVVIDDNPAHQFEFNNVINELKSIDSLSKINVLKPEEGFIKSDLFKKNITEKKENWVVVLTKKASVCAEVVQHLGVMPEEIDITLFTLHYDKNFIGADNNFLARLHFHFPMVNFVDYESASVQQFVRRYTEKNFAEPSDFSFRGFDVTYDTVLRLVSASIFKNPFENGVSERIATRFNYVNTEGNGVENDGVYIVKYDGLNLKIAD
ncbi:LysM peptidoglycan-binding domain-containing protein [Flavobacteriaceae bacterium F08102]|nr:LysM peptidoglycan-binding domain-containing protein [Flavobacteriaceae bacterium F08102]